METNGLFPTSHPTFTSPTHLSSPLSPNLKSPSAYTGHTAWAETAIQTSAVVAETLSERDSLHSQSCDPPALFSCSGNTPPMAKTDSPHLLFSSISEFQPKWSPFGFTHTLSPAGNALGALEMIHATNYNSYSQSSMSPVVPDVLGGIRNGSFRIPDGYGLSNTQQQRPASISEGSTNPQAINPELLQPYEQHSAGVPVSPLRSVSCHLFDSESEYDGPATAAARRKQSEGDIGLETGDRVLEASSAGEGANLVKRRRNLAWLSRSDLKRYEREAKERDMEKQREMAEFEHGPTKGNKREKRRMQNRLAQRTFRARSKIHQQEVADHLSDLEAMTKAQAERLSKLTALVERLQRENASLKKCRWSAAFGHFRNSARGAPFSLEGVQEQVPSDGQGEARAGLKQATQ